MTTIKFLFVLIAGLLVGCQTGPSTPEGAARATILLRTTAANAVGLAVIKDAEGSTPVFQASLIFLDQLLSENVFDPEKLNGFPIEGLGPEARLGVNSLLALYELYFSQHVTGRIEGNENARRFVTAIRDGIRIGLNQ